MLKTSDLSLPLFNISRSLPSSGARCTPMRRRAARPAACPLQESTWAETPPCWSVTCCWPTLESTTVRLRLGESTTGARSTSLCWVSVVRHIALRTNTHTHTHTHTHRLHVCHQVMKRPRPICTYIRTQSLTHIDLITGSLAWHISSVMLTDLMIQFDSDGVIWFRSCCLGSFGLVLLMRWDQKHRTGFGRAQKLIDCVSSGVTWSAFRFNASRRV